MEVKDKMEEKILTMLTGIRPEFNFAESENFIEDGLLDSFDIITLIDMLEEKYHIKRIWNLVMGN